MSNNPNSNQWQRGVNQYGNQYDHRGPGMASGGSLYVYISKFKSIFLCTFTGEFYLHK